IERISHKEQPPSVVFWLEHRMRKADGYLRDIRILDMSGKGMWIHRSMEPLHFKPRCLVIDCAKSGIVVKVILPSYNVSVHLQYYDDSPSGTRHFQTQTTCSSDATPQYSVVESQKQGCQRGIWNGNKTDNTVKVENYAMGWFKDIFGVRGEGLRSKSLESLIIAIVVGGTNIRCASDEAGVATMNLWYMGKSGGISATKKY
nr:hypothetical protein [Tanacetum cinerariifolium]